MAKKSNKSNSEQVASMNETGRRKATDRRCKDEPVAQDRRRASRRRHIDPTTCERDYSEAEIEFMRAMDDYKRASGRMFPTCSEILEVILKLGYAKVGNGNGTPSAPIATFSQDNVCMDENTII